MVKFKIAEGVALYIRTHCGRDGRAVINQTELAKIFNCSANSLHNGIKQLMEAKIVNHSPDPDPGGYTYWFTDDAMMRSDWRETLYLALEMNIAKSSHFSVKQKFGMFKKFARDLEDSFENELSMSKQTINTRDYRIKELEEENKSMRFEMNRMFARMQELETAYNSLVAVANAKEQKAATEVKVVEAG